MQNSYQKFAKDVFIVGLANAAVSLSGIITLPLITKTLGAHDYGVWAQVWVTVTLVAGLVGLGLPYALVRFLPAKTDREDMRDDFYSVLCIVFLAALVAATVLIAAAAPIASAFFSGATPIVRIAALIILVSSLSGVCLSLFQALRQMKRYALFSVVSAYAQVGVIAWLVLNGQGVLSMAVGVLAVGAAMFLILFFMVRSQIGIRRPRFHRVREYLSFGIPTIPAAISGWVVASSDRYVIGYFLGAASVGTYSAGYGLGNLMLMPIYVLSVVLHPAVSKLYDEHRMDEVKTHLAYSLKYLLAVAIPFVFGAYLLGVPVLQIFSTAEIATDGHLIVPLVALGMAFYACCAVGSQVLVLARKTRTIAAIWTTCALVNLGLNIVVVPRWGIVGAGVTTVIAYGLGLGLTGYYSFREFRFSIDWRFMTKSLIASGAMSAVIWRISPDGVLATALTVGAGVGIYGVALILLRGFGKDEISFFGLLLSRSGLTRGSGDDGSE